MRTEHFMVLAFRVAADTHTHKDLKREINLAINRKC